MVQNTEVLLFVSFINSLLFIQIGGVEIRTGPEHDPVFLNVTYGNPDQLSRGFPKSLTLAEIKLILQEEVGLDFTQILVSRLISKGLEKLYIF